jgi:hypothetical protein
MVRATVAFAVVAFGAAAVIAQASEGASLEARDINNDLELREYAVDDLEARANFEELVDVNAREPEFFDDIEARQYEADELVARDPEEEELEARAQAHLPAHSPVHAANSPSQTVTITSAAPSPTACTKKELKARKEQKKVKKAIAFLRSVKDKKDLSAKEKKQVKKARKFLRRVKRRRTKAAKRTVKKCRAAIKKAGFTLKDCKAGADCASALTDSGLTRAKCEAAAKYLKRVQAAKKAKKSGKKSKKNVDAKESSKKSKKSPKSPKKSSKTLAASKTTSSVGPDGVTTVVVHAPGPTCTATSKGSKSKLSKKLVARDLVDEEFESVFAREYEVDELD